jgi:hypothetical protein
LITNVPDDITITEELLERAGYEFGEFGIPWANHVIAKVTNQSPSNLVAALRNGVYERITYEELVAKAEEPIA